MKYSVKKQDGFILYKNENGVEIGTAENEIIIEDGYVFKDLAKTGTLLPYEDWRLGDLERAKDLAGRLSVEDIAGLMMYSPHQMIPALSVGPFQGSYNGKGFEESGVKKWELTDQQKHFLEKDKVRHVLMFQVENTDTAVKWNNRMQHFSEKQQFGIPILFSTDPRHGAANADAEFKSGGEEVSKWPEGLGIAASFSKEDCRKYGEIISREYRALGISMALSPQVDLATEPRWMRLEDTFGTHPQMVADFGKAYCDGLQTTEGSLNGWGKESVCTMSKHWPGGGPCEGGRDAHYPFGKYAVYPGENLKDHLKPFLEGVFQLDGPTKQTSAIMPYYTISWNVDSVNHKNIGNSYSQYIIKDLLREKYGYDGVVCTDWGITQDPEAQIDSFGSRCFGVEELSEAQRHLLAFENGIDQFGGNCNMQPILDAYQLGCEKYGESAMRKRLERSAVRLLKNLFQCGLFENPYLDVKESMAAVGCEEHCKAGYEAQLKSIVLLKNQGVLPISKEKKVYIPKRSIKARKNFLRGMEEAAEVNPIDETQLSGYYKRTENPEDADFALVFVESPLSDGYNALDCNSGGNGYVPISLQYRPYFAEYAREESIAGGDFRESFSNRSYHGKVNSAANEADLDLVIKTKEKMGGKPVVVCIRMHNPAVLSELEPFADGILVDFGVEKRALLDMVSGQAQPSGLLPIQLPKDMKTVEQHCEDVPFDLLAYKDTVGNIYDFAFGLNWDGIIEDSRVTLYKMNKRKK